MQSNLIHRPQKQKKAKLGQLFQYRRGVQKVSWLVGTAPCLTRTRPETS